MSSTLIPQYSKISIIHTASGACVFEFVHNSDVPAPNSRGTFAVVKVLQQLSRDVDFGNLSRSVFIPRTVGSDWQLMTSMSQVQGLGSHWLTLFGFEKSHTLQRFTALLWISCELAANMADFAHNWAAALLHNFEVTFGDDAEKLCMSLPDAEAAPDERAAAEVQLLQQFSSFCSSLQQTAATSAPRKAKV